MEAISARPSFGSDMHDAGPAGDASNKRRRRASRCISRLEACSESNQAARLFSMVICFANAKLRQKGRHKFLADKLAMGGSMGMTQLKRDSCAGIVRARRDNCMAAVPEVVSCSSHCAASSTWPAHPSLGCPQLLQWLLILYDLNCWEFLQFRCLGLCWHDVTVVWNVAQPGSKPTCIQARFG